MDEKGYIMLLNEKGETIEMTKNYQIPPDALDYIIFKKGDRVKAKNCDTERYEFKGEAGVDDAEVVNNVISALSPIGGIVYIKPGIYTVENIKLKSNVSIVGGGMGATILQAPSPQTNPIIITDAEAISGVTLANFRVKGSDRGSYGIDLHNATQFDDTCRIVDVAIEGCKYGIHGSKDDRTWILARCEILDCDYGLYVINNHPYVYDCRFSQNATAIGGSLLYHIPIERCIIERNNVGIDGTSMKRSRIHLCRFAWNFQKDIVLGGEQIEIADCEFNCAESMVAGIELNHNAGYISIHDIKTEYNTGGAYSKGFIYFNLSGTGDYYARVHIDSVDSYDLPSDFIYIDNPNKQLIKYVEIMGNTLYQLRGHFVKTSDLYQIGHWHITDNLIEFVGNIGTDGIIEIHNPRSGWGNIISNNTIVNGGTCGYGIVVNASDSVITGNKFRNCTMNVTATTAETIIANNKGYTTENGGIATFSGDGSTTDFLIGDHGLVVTDPTKIVVKVTPISADAIAASPCAGYVDPADHTKIRVKFASPPASGTDNVQIVWEAQVVYV